MPRKRRGPATVKGAKKKASRSRKGHSPRPVKARARPAARAVTAGLAAAVARGAAVISAADTQEVTVSVDVDQNHLVPYSVAWDGVIVMDELASASTTFTVSAGSHRLSWGFIHGFESEWHHRVTVDVGDGDAQEVESKSSANGDQPNTAGMVVVNA